MKGQDQPGSARARADQPARVGWSDLARAAGYDGAETPEPETLAQLINLSPDAQQLGPVLYEIVQQNILGPSDTESAAQAHGVTGRFLAGLNVDVLASALRSQSNTGERKRLLHAAVDVLNAAALRTLGLATASASGSAASSLDVLLSKLELQVGRASPPGQTELESYRALLHALVETGAATGGEAQGAIRRYAREPAEIAPEPERVLQLALESGALGPIVWEAVADFARESEPVRALALLKGAPEDSAAAVLIAQRFADPERLSSLLREDPVDFGAVDALLRHMGLNAAEPLLDELVSSGSRATRRGILNRLAAFGPAIEPLIVPRLSDDRWFVLRNMLHVLNEANCAVRGVPLAAYQNHADPRVRREALQLLLRKNDTREQALTSALRDSDPTTIQIALKAARAGLPTEAAAILARRVDDADFPPEFRARARALLEGSAASSDLHGGETDADDELA